MSDKSTYLQSKRDEVLRLIKPMCEGFNIKEYDYIIEEDNREVLKLNDTRIGCTSNSLSAIVEEVVGYIFINLYCKERWWHFKPQTINAIKKYWEI